MITVTFRSADLSNYDLPKAIKNEADASPFALTWGGCYAA